MAARGYVVRGTVQGVGFRMYVLRLGLGHGFKGEVWNRPDGAVEVVAEHEQAERLEWLLKALWDGPGEVREVVDRPLDDQGFAEFRIAHARRVL
ncbi:MAG: acylphosphatase [Fimbriimonas ginsengisoli]|uniref:acylphosphatase n=1 Tax=Fimbriimonas ginsengisoli TaxID=1005039 RepID=A0A931M0J8_FIMGI|nr:acylphosphatase [Fimbriimonas ginsengisoli]MBI3721465.1 acylphosphatase [Fimbriimonas ginsengisoli]